MIGLFDILCIVGGNIKWLARWLTTEYGVGNSSDLAVTLRSLKEEIRSCKEDNDRSI